MRCWSTHHAAAAAILATLAMPGPVRSQDAPPAHAQPPWGLIGATGYGALGFALGFGAGLAIGGTDLSNQGPTYIAALVGAGAGAVRGSSLGARASRRLARGESVRRGDRNALVVGSTLAGGVVGSLAAMALIVGQEEGTILGKDGPTFALLSGGGLVLGAAFAVTRHIPVRQAEVSLVPAMVGRRRLALAVSITHGQHRFQRVSTPRPVGPSPASRLAAPDSTRLGAPPVRGGGAGGPP